MKHIWVVQSVCIEETDNIQIFSSQDKADKYIVDNVDIDGEPEYQLIGWRYVQ